MVMTVDSWSEIELMRTKGSKIVPKIGEKDMKCGADDQSQPCMLVSGKTLGKESTILKGDGVPFLYKPAYPLPTEITHNLYSLYTHSTVRTSKVAK